MKENICNTDFDAKFDAISEGLLSWYPWIGKDYAKTKILIIPESHYQNDIQNTNSEKKEYTRMVVNECLAKQEWHNKTLEAFPKAIAGKKEFNHKVLWDNLAYYNFVQRTMNYIGNNREKPNEKDFAKGWETFKYVADILKPSVCIFIGVRACQYIKNAFGDKQISFYYPEKGKLNNVWLRPVFTVTMPYGALKIMFTKHAGHYYKWEVWHKYLKKSVPNETEFLSRL